MSAGGTPPSGASDADGTPPSGASGAGGRLERRYALALRLYPAAYRHERGPELTATLEEAAEHGKRPQLGALVLGALRAHAGTERRTVRSSWLAAARVAAVMVLVVTVAGTPIQMAFDLTQGSPNVWDLLPVYTPDLAAAPLGLIAIVAALRGRHRIAAAAAVAAFGTALAVLLVQDLPMMGTFAHYPVAVLLLVPLFREVRQPAQGLLRYLPVVALVWLVAAYGIAPSTWYGEIALNAVIWLVALLWAVVDERVTIAIGLMLLGNLVHFGVVLMAWSGVGALVDAPAAAIVELAGGLVVAPAVVLAVSTYAARRQARV